jgi:hypothetical protein
MNPVPIIIGAGVIWLLAQKRGVSSAITPAPVPAVSWDGIVDLPGSVVEETSFRDLWASMAKKYKRRIVQILGAILALGVTGIVLTAPTVVGGIAMAGATMALCALAMALYSKRLDNMSSSTGKGPKRAAEACRRLSGFFLFAGETSAQAAGVAIKASDEEALGTLVDEQGSGELTEESVDLVISSYPEDTVKTVDGMI